MKPITEKQKRVLAFIQKRAQGGVPPTVREICRACDINSTSSVHAYLKVLEDGGYISRQSNLTRSIRVTGEDVARVPLLGKITAGQPILAVEQAEEYVPYSGGDFEPGELFALRVVGESMINAGILDNDIVICRRTPVADDGDIVAALIGDEATVKRFFKEKKQIRLQPENDAFKPIYVNEIIILGRVISLVRNF